jgi:hypothetical protein
MEFFQEAWFDIRDDVSKTYFRKPSIKGLCIGNLKQAYQSLARGMEPYCQLKTNMNFAIYVQNYFKDFG